MARPEVAHAEPLRPARGDRRIAPSTQDSSLHEQISIGPLVAANQSAYGLLTRVAEQVRRGLVDCDLNQRGTV